MHNLNDKPASSASASTPPGDGAQSAHAAQGSPFPKAGDAAGADASAGAPLPSTKQAVDGAHDAVDSVAQAADDFFKRLIEGVRAAIDKLADATGPTVERIAGALSNPTGKASSLLGQASDKKEAWLSDARDIVREHPIAAIAVALAAGAVYARLTAPPRLDPHDGMDN